MSIAPLATLDYVFASEAFDPSQLVLLYAGELDLARLEQSFAATARDFAGVNATLTRLDDRTLGFDLSAQAAEFRVGAAESEQALAACVQPVRTALGEPLARATVTPLGRRGTALALSLSHAVADGYGYFLFLSAWAARARGQPFPAVSCDRRALVAPPGQEAIEPGELSNAGLSFAEDGPDRRPPLQFRERRLSPQELAGQVQGEDKEPYSANDSLSALLWKEAMADSPLPQTLFTCAVDIRRNRPSLGPLFFGNATFAASVSVPTDKLRAANVREVASWIRAAVSAVPERIDAGLREVEAVRMQLGLGALARFRTVHPLGGFLVSNLSKIPFDALDFGAGPPQAMEPAAVPPPRVRSCAVFRGPGGDFRLLSLA